MGIKSPELPKPIFPWTVVSWDRKSPSNPRRTQILVPNPLVYGSWSSVGCNVPQSGRISSVKGTAECFGWGDKLLCRRVLNPIKVLHWPLCQRLYVKTSGKTLRMGPLGMPSGVHTYVDAVSSGPDILLSKCLGISRHWILLVLDLQLSA